MTKEQNMVREFHEKFQCTINQWPTFPTPEDRELRLALIEEEFRELSAPGSIVDIADALGDLLYVVYGTAITYGIDLEPIFAEIHRSNMSKLWGGIVKKNEYGKVIKSPDYSPANLQPILAAQSTETCFECEKHPSNCICEE
jgi:predicted HAD superfamily Cof-like phosphohydrolase